MNENMEMKEVKNAPEALEVEAQNNGEFEENREHLQNNETEAHAPNQHDILAQNTALEQNAPIDAQPELMGENAETMSPEEEYNYYKGKADYYFGIKNQNNQKANEIQRKLRSGKIEPSKRASEEAKMNEYRRKAVDADYKLKECQRKMGDALQRRTRGYAVLESDLNQPTVENASITVCRQSRTPQYLW